MTEHETGGGQSPKGVPFEQDPLLGSDAFIDTGYKDAGGEKQNGKFTPGVPIDARPISSYPPQETTPTKKRSHEEMSKRPPWLPEDWKLVLKERISGATKGVIDRYYVAPTGSGKRRFRSKNEVLHFLETGEEPIKKPDSSSFSKSPGSKSGNKTSSKSRKVSGSSASGAKVT